MNPTRTFDFLKEQLEQYPLQVCLSQKIDDSWVSYSTQEVADIVEQLALGLLSNGMEAGDKVGIISSNRPEWNFIDLACAQVGIISVPIYPTITLEDYKYIFKHCEVKALFISNEDLVNRATLALEGTPVDIYSFDQIDGVQYWKELLANEDSEMSSKRQELMDNIKPDDLMTIIYTSGTTGFPKGVMLSHNNVVTNALAIKDSLREVGDKALSFLPLCHVLERTASFFYISSGVSIYYAESIETIGVDIKDVKPNIFVTVPRLLEKIYDKIIAKGLELNGVKKALFFWAVNLGVKFDPEINRGLWYNLQLKIARILIFSKWKEALGGSLKYVAIGSASLQPRLSRVFFAAQIPLCEGYGLTETSPCISFNIPLEGKSRIGTVGKLLKDIEVKIAEDGEILCKGPNVMLGYYKQPELTKEGFTDEWFHTGDIGDMQDGFLRITDRKKEMFKTSGGKYVAPQVLENVFKESIYIEQAMVIGEGRKFPAALFIPNFEILKEWCIKRDLVFTSDASILKLPDVKSLFETEISRYNERFGKWEQVKKFELLDELWSVESGELTPSLKLKRKVIMSNCISITEAIYT